MIEEGNKISRWIYGPFLKIQQRFTIFTIKIIKKMIIQTIN